MTRPLRSRRRQLAGAFSVLAGAFSLLAGAFSPLAGALLLLAAAVAGCDDGPPPGPLVAPRPAWTSERTSVANELAARLAELPDADGVVVRLAFGPEADLDLYVTGPLEETVYYANTPSRIGGELVEDRRCEQASGSQEGAQIEEVRFPAVAGRYRVGVDYPRACGDTRAPAPFGLRVDAPGNRVEHRAIAVHQVFEPIVLEFEVGVDAATRTSPEDSR